MSLADRITKPDGGTVSNDVDLADAQTDGAPPAQNGSGLQDAEYDVQVKLSDLQQDPNNPLFSAKTFEELQL